MNKFLPIGIYRNKINKFLYVGSLMKLELIREIDLKNFGEIEARIGDINGDKKPEIVFFQAEDIPKRRLSTGGYLQEKTFTCITAMDLQGNIIWQTGTPRPPDGRIFHGPGASHIFDINEKGESRIVYISIENNLPQMRLINGRNGELIKERETGPSWAIFPADLRGLGKKRDFIVNTAVIPLSAFTEDLEPIWEYCYIYGSGHSITAADVEGKGRDDVFAGVCRVDAKCNRIWWRPDLDDAMEEMGNCPHVDSVYVHKLFHDKNEFQVLWIGGKDVMCLNAISGEVIWRMTGEHLQHGVPGYFDPDCKDKLIYIAEKSHELPSYMVTANGKVLWEKMMGAGYALILNKTGENGEDLIINRLPPVGESPYIFDYKGDIVARFPIAPIKAGRKLPGDTGTRYLYNDDGTAWNFHNVDLDNDGADEIIVHNRSVMYMFKLVK